MQMKRGKTEVETLRLNGWGIGDLLEGREGNRVSRILITHIGEERFGCKWDYHCNGDFTEERFCTTLSCREWYKVGSVPSGREFNPTTSSLTDSQAREHAEIAKQCSDGKACGNPYCEDCPNLPAHEADSRMLDAQLMADMGKSPDKHYRHSYKGIKLDPYRIAKIYDMQGGPREQIMKKCLRFTDKGHTEQQVVNEIRSALSRWQDMIDEDN